MMPATSSKSVVQECVNNIRQGVYANTRDHCFTLVKIGLAIPLTIIALPASIIEAIIRIVTLPLIALSLPFTRAPMIDALAGLKYSFGAIIQSPILIVLNIVLLIQGICRGYITRF